MAAARENRRTSCLPITMLSSDMKGIVPFRLGSLAMDGIGYVVLIIATLGFD